MSEFLAEARILVRPDTTRFREELQAQLAAAVAKTPVTVPVTAAFAGSAQGQQQAAKAASELAAAQGTVNNLLGRGAVLLDENAIAAENMAKAEEAAGAAKVRSASATREAARQQSLAATAAQRLAFSQQEVVGTASAVASAQVTLTRSTAAVAAAERALGAALEFKNIALIDAAAQSLRLSQAQELEALTALQAARAQAAHAGSLGAVRTAGFAAGAQMLGLRGAVLTAGTAFLGATVAIQAFSRGVGAFVDFERELATFEVTAGATATEMERVSRVSRELGSDITLPGVSATDAAEGLSLLARAGLDVNESLGAIRGTLQLATAAQIDNATASELVANALNTFRLEGEEATRVADLFAGAANESQGSIEDMGIALRQVAPVAALVNFSIEDTITLLTQLSRSGLSASDAGTSLRQAILRLIQDLPKVQKVVGDLCLNLRDASGELRVEVFAELREELEKMSPAARQAAIAALGGADAIRSLGLLARGGAEEFLALREAITQQGIASEVASARTSGLGGDIEAAKNEFTELGITVGKVASGPLSLFARAASTAAGAINDVNRELEESRQGPWELLEQQITELGTSFTRLNFQFRAGATGASNVGSEFSELDTVAKSVTETIEGLADAFGALGAELAEDQGRPQDQGLGVEQILNRVEGLDAAEVRARISGSTQELLNVLREQEAFLRGQLERQFVRNRPALRRQLEQALLGTINDISAITKSAAGETKRAAQEAVQARNEADAALLELLGSRREDAARRIAAAAETESLKDDIRAQNVLQALIKQQIQKIRERIRDEQTRRAAIRELRIALIASRQEEERLRQEQAQAAAERRQQSIELDIELAVTTENEAREIAARRKLIKLLQERQRDVKKGTIEWKRLRNEIARQRAAINDALDEAEDGVDSRKRAAEFFFEQLQAQQGFASNLLGNLITGPTEGLVGVPAPIGGPGTPPARIAAEVQAERGLSTGGPSSGQVSTTNDILLRILQQLKQLNGETAAPEARYQRRQASGSMDIQQM